MAKKKEKENEQIDYEVIVVPQVDENNELYISFDDENRKAYVKAELIDGIKAKAPEGLDEKALDNHISDTLTDMVNSAMRQAIEYAEKEKAAKESAE